MPLYLYRNPDTEKMIEVVQGMGEEHSYTDEDGLEWERVWTVFNASVDSVVNPFSEKDFVNKTNKMKGSMGDIWDYSKELGEKRKSKEGKDSIKVAHDKVREEKLSKARKRNAIKDFKKARKAVKKKKR